MTLLKISIDLLPMVGIVLSACAAGFLVRGGQLRSFRRRIIELENEMVGNHAEILDLQKEKAQLLKQMKESKIPVIPIHLSKDEKDRDKKMAGNSHQNN